MSVERWLVEFNMMNNVRNPSTFSPGNHASTERETDFRHPLDWQGPSFEQDVLDTISELPEHCENTGSVEIKTDGVEDAPPLTLHESDTLETKSVLTSKICCENTEMPSSKCNEEESNSKSSPASTLQSLSPPSSSSSSPCHHLKSDQEDALSADEGIQTSPPFERDDPWDHHDDLNGKTPTRRRRYSMSEAMVQRPRRLTDDDVGVEDVILRSPNKSWLADELKARRSRYRPKSCSLPHVEWLKQRTETALDRSAEMQRRTADLLRSAKAVRDQDV